MFQNKAFSGLPQNPHTRFSSIIPLPPLSTSHYTPVVLCCVLVESQFCCGGWFVGPICVSLCVCEFWGGELCSAPTAPRSVLFCFWVVCRFVYLGFGVGLFQGVSGWAVVSTWHCFPFYHGHCVAWSVQRQCQFPSLYYTPHHTHTHCALF